MTDIYKYEMFGIDEVKSLINKYKELNGCSADALNSSEAEELTKIIHAQIDWCEGNIGDEEFNDRLREAVAR